jgi:hypothetical protein
MFCSDCDEVVTNTDGVFECSCTKKSHCEDCGTVICRNCDPDSMVSDEAGQRCVPCDTKQTTEASVLWRHLSGQVRQHAEATRSLGIPSDATDEEVMAVARRLK